MSYTKLTLIIIVLLFIIISCLQLSNTYVPNRSYYANQNLFEAIPDCPYLTELDGGQFCMGNGGVIEIVPPKKYFHLKSLANSPIKNDGRIYIVIEVMFIIVYYFN